MNPADRTPRLPDSSPGKVHVARLHFMKRYHAVMGAVACALLMLTLGVASSSAPAHTSKSGRGMVKQARPAATALLTPPAKGPIRVAVVLSPGAAMIDYAGPWEVFQDVRVAGRGTTALESMPFELFTVAANRDPFRVSGGLQVVPDHTFADAPQPQLIVVGAQGEVPQAMVEWLRKMAPGADLTMSVCTGAFALARTGLLDGHAATTHHESYGPFEREFPNVRLVKDVRFVESGRLACAGGLTSGIDLALRVVARYFGEPIAAQTAAHMEYGGTRWHAADGVWDDGLAAAKPVPGKIPGAKPVLKGLDPVRLARGEEVHGADSLDVTRGRYRYLFADAGSRAMFLAHPARYEIQLDGACAFMATSGAGPGSGDPDRYAIHNGHIYIFASTGCRESFVKDPVRYLPRPVAGAEDE